MSMLPTLLGYTLVLYVGWRLFRHVFLGSSLDNIPGPQSESFIGGNVGRIFHREAWAYQDKLVAQYGRLFTVNGVLNTKWLYTYDPRALHSIYVKDQDVFEESELILLNMLLFIGPGLLGTIGNQHRRQRKMLNPVFSAKHLREMTPLFVDVVHRLETAITSRLQDGPREIDMLSWMGRTALELVGLGGFGRSFDPLTEDVADEFADAIKSYFPVEADVHMLVRLSLPVVIKMGPAAFRRAVAERIPNHTLQRMRKISDILYANSLEIVNGKKEALKQGDQALKRQVGEGKDIMSVLLRANMEASEEDRLPDQEVVAQVSTLILAAMDTTSNALSRTLQFLAMHPDIQQRLRNELVQARDDSTGSLRDLSYDEVMELPFLDSVCRETLRVFPPIRSLARAVRKDGVLPLSAPIRGVDGTPIHSVPVKKGMMVLTDLYACNTDEKLWGEDAKEWKPGRWLKPLPRALEEAPIPGVYSHMMTFIGGGRACIGFKFSQLEMKIVLATLLPAFQFELTEAPIFWNAAGVSYPSVGGYSPTPAMPLRVTRLKEWV